MEDIKKRLEALSSNLSDAWQKLSLDNKLARFSELETIVADFATLEQAILSADYDSVQKLIDMESFIDFILLQEITRNVKPSLPTQRFGKTPRTQKIKILNFLA